MGKIKKFLEHHDSLYIIAYKIFVGIYYKPFSTEHIIRRGYKKNIGKPLDLDNPKTFSEKIQWMKLNYRNPFYAVAADKYAVREYVAKELGEEYLIPLLFQTYDWREVTYENMPDEPFVLKSNNQSGVCAVRLIRDKNTINWKKMRKVAKFWSGISHYDTSREWHYKEMRPCVIAEKMLVNADGKIPNDYKLHYINGKLEFVYCAIDREGGNYRNIYDADWKPVPFHLIRKEKYRDDLRGPEIEAPSTFEEMKRLGNIIAKNFPYVRCDFYDCDGKLYMGEITIYHGSGFDSFMPDEYDAIFGEKLILPEKNA